MSETQENKFKARLVHFRDNNQIFIIKNSPAISESRAANYQEINPIHMPGSIMAYTTTPSRTFSVSDVKLISQTPGQASKNINDLQMIRSWLLPRFGTGEVFKANTPQPLEAENITNFVLKPGEVLKNNAAINRNKQASAKNAKMIASNNAHNNKINGSQLLGMPPPLLYFSAYSDPGAGSEFLQNLRRIPVVMTNLSIAYPNDLDYIPTEDGVPFPTIMTIGFELAETHSPATFNTFSLDAFRSGTLKDF